MIWIIFLLDYNIYYANLHSHTNLSDGEGTPAEAFLYARDSAGIDILAITDHSYYLTEAKYQELKDAAQQTAIEGRFVALFGQEFGSVGQDGFGHVDVFEGDSVCAVSRSDLTACYDWLARQNKPAQFNHPAYNNKNFSDFAYNSRVDQAMGLLELLNQHNLAESELVLCLSKGWQIGVTANQDNHHRQWGDLVNQNGDIPLTGVLARSLKKDDILDALVKGRTYAFEASPEGDRIKLDFTIDNIAMGEELITPRRTITIKVRAEALNNFDRLYLYRNGFAIDSVLGIARPAFEHTKIDTAGNDYYYVKLMQEDSDRVWSSPIWVEVRETKDVVEIWPNPVRGQRVKILFPTDDDFRSGQIIIGNVLGQRVLSRRLGSGGEVVIDTHTFPLGVYFVKIEIFNKLGDRITYTGKMAVIQ